MLFVLAILIAGLWAAFMLPAFFDDRGRAPRSTTKAFARRRALLGELAAAQPDSDAYVRHHAQVKRQRILVGLAVAALLTLVVATMTGSLAWLLLTIAIDVGFASYVALLLHTKQQARMPRAAVVPIGVAAAAAVESNENAESPVDQQTPTVRVIAG